MDTYEPMDTSNDPYLVLLATRGEIDDSDEDELVSTYLSALSRARSYEAEKVRGDWLGASPAELNEVKHIRINQ